MSFYLLKRKNLTDDPNSPLFLHNNHLPLTCSHMVNSTKLHIATLGLQTDQYSGHSYRIGGATDAANSGLSDWEIKLMGRWSSDAYLGYIRAPTSLLADLTRRMTSHSSPPIISSTILKKMPWAKSFHDVGLLAHD